MCKRNWANELVIFASFSTGPIARSSSVCFLFSSTPILHLLFLAFLLDHVYNLSSYLIFGKRENFWIIPLKILNVSLWYTYTQFYFIFSFSLIIQTCTNDPIIHLVRLPYGSSDFYQLLRQNCDRRYFWIIDTILGY